MNLIVIFVIAVEEMERHQSNTASKTRALENEVQSLQQEGEKLEREIILKRKTLEMLPSAADNIGTWSVICYPNLSLLATLFATIFALLC
jgi:uncharacterized protein YlxW (UPF0749 family)